MRRFHRTLVSASAARAYAWDALMRGSDHADLAGNCEKPVMVSFTGLKDSRLAHLEQLRDNVGVMDTDYAPGHGWIGQAPDPPKAEITNIDLAVKCRKCPPCLADRARHWRHRAAAEIEAGDRTWFGTLTLRPHEHFLMISQARARLAGTGLDWDSLEPEDQWKERLRPLIAEWQRYMKRLRKHHRGRVKYCLVVERHKSGEPHLHCLLHEDSVPVRHKLLSSQWQLGFSQWKLVAEHEGNRAAYYVTKYLTKSLFSRICASRGYGRSMTDRLDGSHLR
jgi:hypothetical protein